MKMNNKVKIAWIGFACVTIDEFSRFLGSVEKISPSVLFTVNGLKKFDEQIKK